jgi:hypothetical protein
MMGHLFGWGAVSMLALACAARAGEPDTIVHVVGDSGILRFHERTGQLIDVWSAGGGGGTGLAIDDAGFLYRFSTNADTFDGATGELLFRWFDFPFVTMGQADTGSDGQVGFAFEVDDVDLRGGCMARMVEFRPWVTACPEFWPFLPPGFSRHGTLGAINNRSNFLDVYIQDMPDGPLQLAGSFFVDWFPRRLEFGAGGQLYFTDSASPTVHRFTPFSNRPPEPFFDGPGAPAGFVELGPDGALWLSNRATRQILRYDEETGELLGLFAAHPEISAEIAFGEARVPFWASSIDVAQGSLVSGGLDDLTRNDGAFMVVAPDAGLTAVIHLTAHLPLDVLPRLTRFGLNFEFACMGAGPSPVVTALFTHVPSGELHTFAAAVIPSDFLCNTLQFQSAGWAYRVSPPGDYIDANGAVTMELRATRAIPFEISLDRVKFDYSVESAFCPADCNADSLVDIFDFLCFQGKITTGDLSADCNADGTLNIFDFLCFQGLVTRGCP